MAEYRNFIRYAEGFDGTTIEATGIYTQSKVAWTTTIDTAVGIFPPLALGRVNVASQVRVAVEGTVGGGDTLSVNDSTGATRYTAPVSAETSGWLFLAPQDSLVLRATALTKVDILVRDLNAEEMDELALNEALEALSP